MSTYLDQQSAKRVQCPLYHRYYNRRAYRMENTMNILILTGRFGMGHYSAAEAIKQELLLTNADENVTIIDIMDYIAPALGDFIYKDFNFLVSKCSKLYNFLNEITENALKLC